MDLLERSDQLDALAGALAGARAGRGRLVFVAGEAGVGKTALVRGFCADAGGTVRTIWGACDALFTARPLGPFVDIAEETGGPFAEVVAGGAKPYEVVAALVRELRARKPTVAVLEDLHNADEATLDALTLLGRRIEGVPALVLATYRDDEVDGAHPLRVVLGELATSETTTRVSLGRLSPAAVAELAASSALDADELYVRTGGNPFFVTEVVAAGGGEIPETVRDAVLARVARLSPGARTLLEAMAVSPAQVDVWLLERLAGDTVDRLDECLAAGIVLAEPTGVAFRHELARLAVEEALPPTRRVALHRDALAALESSPTGVADPARLAHHAEAAGDAEAVMRFAPAAAERAATLGAHREAAAQYERALRFAERMAPDLRADLTERLAYEWYVTGQMEDALAVQQRAVRARRELGDVVKEADSLRSLSRILRFAGRTSEAVPVAEEAVALLDRLPPSHELAMAYAGLSHLYVNAEDVDGAVAWNARALDLAERLGDTEAIVYARTNFGAIEFLTGLGTETLERALEVGREAGLHEPVGRLFINLVWWPLLRDRKLAFAAGYLEAGLEYCGERGLDVWRLFLLACRSRLDLDRGRWNEAASVLRDARAWPVPRILALTVLALVRARRGDPDVTAPLAQARELAEPTGELQRLAPVAAATAEAFWLAGRPEAIDEATVGVLEEAVRRRSAWVVSELVYWRRLAGLRDDVAVAAEPYALQIAGAWAEAAARWREIGSPYQAALALGEADDPTAVRSALEELQRLGARRAVAIVSQRLRELGVRGVPRGPRASTRKNPANLTSRELEVLALVAEGLRNAEIASRLFVTEKTVGHHVSAILRKLSVRTRTEASAEAARLGLTS